MLTPASATATSGNAALAIDAIQGTRWESEFNDAQSLTVDLGLVTTVNTVTIDWETANAKDYILKGSTDGLVWVDIQTLTDMPAGERTDAIEDIGAQYRYLKMEGVSRNTAYGYSIYEFHVCDNAITPPVICNAVLPVSAVASTGNATLAIDGNGGTRWESEPSDFQSLTVDYGMPVDVISVSIDWETANAKDYTLKGSLDGTVWVDIETLTDMPTGPRTDVIDEIDAQYRYLKMDGILRNTPYGYSIYEFEVCGPEIVVPPFECNAVAAVSATATSGNAALAIDGNEGSRWESESTDAQSLTVDLGELADVNAVTIMWETANAKDYILKGSVDGTVWVDIETLTDMATGERTDIIDEIDAQYRYIKMEGVLRNTQYGYSIYELAVCGEIIDVEPPFECEPVAAASATATSGNAALAIDGDAGSRWESEPTDAQSLTVDLGEVANINGVTIAWETANAKDYVLKGSVDGTVWTDIETLTDMPVGERTDIIDEIDAQYRYIKMEGITRNTQYGYSVYEMQVCGEVIPEPVDCDALAIAGATATSGNAALAVDGIAGSRWESEFTDAQSLTVDLGLVTEVNVVTITWETANAKDYILKGSVNGIEWTDIETLTNMATGERTDVIDGINAEYQYLKMEGVLRNTPYGYSIYEFSVCGEGLAIIYTAIPALIEAEDYYAMSGVQQEATTDAGGGQSLGWIDLGDWMEYNITAATAGEYVVNYRVASAQTTGVIELLIDSVSAGTLAVPNTGGWQVWQTISKNINLTEGNHTIRIQAAAVAFNLNWVEFVTPEVVGLDSFSKSGVMMYPNPANGFVNLELLNNAYVQIFNPYGTLVQEQGVSAGKSTLNLQGYATGLYLVKVDNKVFKLLVK
ncbi:hypothetical protein Q766_02545 [Flavobacterium subsaxonicum WB 4.1-42 = DSM 21790]|uniref:Carbohydrate-binding protein n=1 Tax=Flavobacterium subsaxonicum WB 4.1-42 = DSM 21790 TaxID=1121898 RepID=A0A0A2MRP0_9FLAO|nr:hypothetical protein Q766_02545 [Flavobacterium subsaxonicum WB 4.1-42 = DSM 21790]